MKQPSNGQKLAESILERWELNAHEAALLAEVVRTVDQLDDLAAVVETDGLIVDGKYGPKVHPAAVEARQLRITLARLIVALRLPEEVVDGRTQRRGIRGVYGISGAV